jgi:hypothetical protein
VQPWHLFSVTWSTLSRLEHLRRDFEYDALDALVHQARICRAVEMAPWVDENRSLG